MKDKIKKILDKYIEYKTTEENLITHYEGKINNKLVIVRYSDTWNKLFCGIQFGNVRMTEDAKKHGNRVLKDFENDLSKEEKNKIYD